MLNIQAPIAQEKVINIQPGFFFWLGVKILTKPHPNSVKTILGLIVQGGNSVKSHVVLPC